MDISQIKSDTSRVRKQIEERKQQISEKNIFGNTSTNNNASGIDANGDGIITEEEMVKFGYSFSGIDNKLDTDKDGNLTYEETRDGISFTSDMVNISDEEAQKYFAAGFKPYGSPGNYSVSRNQQDEYNFYNKDLSSYLDMDGDGKVSDAEALVGYMKDTFVFRPAPAKTLPKPPVTPTPPQTP